MNDRSFIAKDVQSAYSRAQQGYARSNKNDVACSRGFPNRLARLPYPDNLTRKFNKERLIDQKKVCSAQIQLQTRRTAMSAVMSSPAHSKRTASKEARRQQLIEATIQSIAKHGLSDTTIATVAKEAQLSQGIVNLHFQSKQGLLIETLRSVADEYKEAWEKALASAGPSHAEKIEALVNVDFCHAVWDRTKIAVWFAYWSETKSRPTYRKLCAERDREYDRKLNELVKALIAEGDYHSLDAATITDGISAMSAGFWLDLLVDPRSMTRERARLACRMFLCQLFPRHFTAAGN